MICTYILLALFSLNIAESTVLDTDNNSNRHAPDPPIAAIGDTDILLSELMATYNRNPGQHETIREGLLEFLPKYIHYRLKLMEGYDAGFHQAPDLLEEFETYAREAAYSYWLENSVKESIINTFKERMQYELKAFHILQEITPDASPEDTAAAYNRMLEARNLLLEGADAEQINHGYSTIRNGNPMGGPLPWITAGRTVHEFEDALYKLSPGEISMPVRTQFGYHVIHLQEKRDRSAERRVSHIFFQPADNDSIANLVQQAWRELREGAAWQDVADQYSMDRASAARGGEVGWVGYGMQFPEPFVDVVMQARPEQLFSEPLEMEYGYHIIRVDSVRTFAGEEEYNNYVREQLSRLQRLSPERDEVYSHIKELGNFQMDKDIYHSVFNDGRIDPKKMETFGEQIVIRLFSTNLTVAQMHAYLEENENIEDFTVADSDDLANYFLRQWLVDLTFDHFSTYASEMTDFLNGLVVFRVNEEFIWNPDRMDQKALEQFYRDHADRYQYDRQFTYYRFSTVSDSLIAAAESALHAGTSPSELAVNFDELQVRRDSTRNRSATAYTTLEPLQPGEFSDIESSGSLKYFYYLEKIEEPRAMTFQEAFNRVTADYQPIREEKYLGKLMKKYSVTLFPENI